MKKACFLTLIQMLLALSIFSQTTVQEDAYNLYIRAIKEQSLDAKIQLFEEYLAKYGKIGLDYDKYVYANLALSYNQKKDYEKTVDFGEKAISAQDIDNLTKIQLYLTISGAYNELNRNLEKAHNYAKIAEELITTQKESGSTVLTQQQWTQLLASVNFLSGSIHVKKGELKEGIDKWVDAYKVLKSPQILRQFKVNGIAQYNQKKYSNAEIFFKSHFELSGDPDSAYWLGKTCFFLDKLDEAEKYFLLAYDKRKNSEIALNLGIITNKKKKVDEAIKYFAEAVVLNSHSKFSADAKKYLEKLYQEKYGNIEGIDRLLTDARKRLGLS